MQIYTHILAGWCIGNYTARTPRERLLCMIASVLPDLDGIGIFVDVKYYWAYHHVLGHNIFAGLLFTGILLAFSEWRLWNAVLYYFMFSLHLVLDYLGSGPGWGIHLLWPVSGYYLENPNVWNLSSWQNMLVCFVLFVWTVVIAFTKKQTPLETVSNSLNTKCVSWIENFVAK